MAKVSAGLLMTKVVDDELYFLLVHPGGPFFRNKDLGSWTIPKGLVDEDEDMLQTAIREFNEETGVQAEAPYHSLGHIKQKGGKVVHAWAFSIPDKYIGWDPQKDLTSNSFELEWPPRSGQFRAFPEIDRAAWFNMEQAAAKINPPQKLFLERATLVQNN